jgi:hypothetical protein
MIHSQTTKDMPVHLPDAAGYAGLRGIADRHVSSITNSGSSRREQRCSSYGVNHSDESLRKDFDLGQEKKSNNSGNDQLA